MVVMGQVALGGMPIPHLDCYLRDAPGIAPRAPRAPRPAPITANMHGPWHGCPQANYFFDS